MQRITEINAEYYSKVPFKPADWVDFIDATKEIHHKSKDNEDVKLVLLGLIQFYDTMHTRMVEGSK